MKRFDWIQLFTWPYKVYVQLGFWAIVLCLFIVLKEYPYSFTGASLICIVLQETLELAIPSYSQNLLILPFFKRGKWVVGAILYIIQIVLLVWLIPFILSGVWVFFSAVFYITNRVFWREEHISFIVTASSVMGPSFKLGLD